VGYLKAVIRVVESDTFVPPEDIQGMSKPKDFVIRVYVLKGEVVAKDDQGTSDPYLRVSGCIVYVSCVPLVRTSFPHVTSMFLDLLNTQLRLGKEVKKDKSSLVKNTTRPSFYKRYDFVTKLPGTSELEVGVIDWDVVGKDDPIGEDMFSYECMSLRHMNVFKFIGATVLDLEDRWFSDKWRDLGTVDPEKGVIRPLETRNLWTATSNQPQANGYVLTFRT
jgi:hypothetical protein